MKHFICTYQDDNIGKLHVVVEHNEEVARLYHESNMKVYRENLEFDREHSLAVIEPTFEEVDLECWAEPVEDDESIVRKVTLVHGVEAPMCNGYLGAPWYLQAGLEPPMLPIEQAVRETLVSWIDRYFETWREDIRPSLVGVPTAEAQASRIEDILYGFAAHLGELYAEGGIEITFSLRHSKMED